VISRRNGSDPFTTFLFNCTAELKEEAVLAARM